VACGAKDPAPHPNRQQRHRHSYPCDVTRASSRDVVELAGHQPGRDPHDAFAVEEQARRS
jgi:hypothetical protein